MKFNFSNRTVLITGGTRGIGKKIAEDLLSLGANLILSGTRFMNWQNNWVQRTAWSLTQLLFF